MISLTRGTPLSNSLERTIHFHNWAEPSGWTEREKKLWILVLYPLSPGSPQQRERALPYHCVGACCCCYRPELSVGLGTREGTKKTARDLSSELQELLLLPALQAETSRRLLELPCLHPALTPRLHTALTSGQEAPKLEMLSSPLAQESLAFWHTSPSSCCYLLPKSQRAEPCPGPGA